MARSQPGRHSRRSADRPSPRRPTVIPAQAGIQTVLAYAAAAPAGNHWIPAYAGRTVVFRKLIWEIALRLNLTRWTRQ